MVTPLWDFMNACATCAAEVSLVFDSENANVNACGSLAAELPEAPPPPLEQAASETPTAVATASAATRRTRLVMCCGMASLPIDLFV